MARLAGRQGAVYMNLASGGTAEPVAFLSSWSMSASSDRIDVTAFGDANKVYVAGLPDATGQFAGFYDDATVQTFTAALDGQPRKIYLYPNRNNNSQYWSGTVYTDFSVNLTVAGAAEISATWSAASPITKTG